jgi:hypothetical protein
MGPFYHIESEGNNQIVPVVLSHSGFIQGCQIWSMLKKSDFLYGQVGFCHKKVGVKIKLGLF